MKKLFLTLLAFTYAAVPFASQNASLRNHAPNAIGCSISEVYDAGTNTDAAHHFFSSSDLDYEKQVPQLSPGSNKMLQFFSGQSIIRDDIETALAFYDQKNAVIRFGEVSINENLKNATANDIDREIVLNLFDDDQFTGTIKGVVMDTNGTLAITAGIAGFDYAHIIMTTSGGRTLVNISIPELQKHYQVISNPHTLVHYLIETDTHRQDALPSSPSLKPPLLSEEGILEQLRIKEELEQRNLGPDDPAFIDVMIVYTPAAETWANQSGGGINNVIANAMATAQLILNNSLTLVTMPLVHSALIDYTESGSSAIDLIRLTASPSFNPWGNYLNGYYIPGYMNEVHTWRDQYGADLVALFSLVDDTGGIAWLLDNKLGMPNSGFSITRVQQASWSSTTIHEFGHNMGCHHHKAQSVQPGPTNWTNWPENNWSAGWRWTDNSGGFYCSVMTYEHGQYFPDGINHTRVPHFSNPSVTYQGVATGHAANGDNARTIKEVKQVVAAYRASTGVFYSLNLEVNPPGAGTTDGAGDYPAGQQISLTANANDGYSFLNWTDQGGAEVSDRESFVYTMPEENITLTANFEQARNVQFQVNDLRGNPVPDAIITINKHEDKGTHSVLKKLSFADRRNHDRKDDEASKAAAPLSGHQTHSQGSNQDGQWIGYTQQVNSGSLGLSGSINWHAAIRWMPADLAIYDGYAVSRIRVYMNDEPNHGTIKLWQGNPDIAAGEWPDDYASQSVTVTENDWVEVELTEPHPIDTGQQLWVGWEMGDKGQNNYPAAYGHINYTPGFSDLLQFGGNNWQPASNFGFNIAWNIEAWVEPYSEEPEVIVLLTDHFGQANFSALPGSYSYVVEKDNYNAVMGNFIVSQEDVSITITLIDDGLPEQLSLAGISIPGDESICFDALQTITTGGDGHFIVESGAQVTLIAGENIIMLPGTTIEHGGYLLASIAINNRDYCGIPRAIEIAEEPATSKEDVAFDNFTNEVHKNGFFKLYPNPTDGTFTLELIIAEPKQKIIAEVHDMLGSRLLVKELPPQRLHTLSLEGQPPGMYIIKIMKGDKVGVERLIKR